MSELSISELKSGHNITHEFLPFIQALGNWRADKGYPREIIEYWLNRQERDGKRRALETLLGRFLMRQPYDVTSQWLHQAIGASLYAAGNATYTGTLPENLLIDRAIADSDDQAGFRDRIRRGATRHFSLDQFQVPSWAGTKTPIVILGAGAAGILAARTLIDAGYRNIRVIDSVNEYGGIWRRKEVQLVRNNPFPFMYEDFLVEAAPGSGLAISNFLDQLVMPPAYTHKKPLPPIIQGRIWRVEPGDLEHTVVYTDEYGKTQTVTTPILINALGLGKPLPLSRPGIIETDVSEAQGGKRWQHHISLEEAERLRGKRIVFVGLGNSTIEMVVQLQKLNQAGLNIKYKVLTHYSRQALRYPEYADQEGKKLYRDISYPRLSKLAGDLEHIDVAYRHAWESNDPEVEEIIADVYHWTIEPDEDGGQVLVVKTKQSPYSHRFEFHELYSLIGYGYSPEEVAELGLTTFGKGTPAKIAHDYDGEVQKHPVQLGRDRLYPGYFSFGALLSLPNAQVIPGMLFRLPDLLVGVALRSTEHMLKRRSHIKLPSKKEFSK